MTILVCDDDKEIVEAISIYLKQEGYNIIPAYNGKEALQVMEKEEIHLIILDIMMPELDGIHALLRLREKSSIPVILLSAKLCDQAIQSVRADCKGKIPAEKIYKAGRDRAEQ